MSGIFSEPGEFEGQGKCITARLEVYFVLLEYIFFDIRNMGSQNANVLTPGKF